MVFKVNKNKNYTVMSNYHLRDQSLSLKAKGLLSYMLSLPDDWDYSVRGLVSICKEGKDAIKSTLDELRENDYLELEKVKNDTGWFIYNYIIYENPKKMMEKSQENPCAGFPCMDIPATENPQRINTKEQIDKIDKSNSTINSNHFITNYLIRNNFINDDEFYLDYYNNMFSDLIKIYDTKKVISVTSYIIDNLMNRDFLDENYEVIENKFCYLKKSIINNIEMFEVSYDEIDELEL